MHFAIEVVNLGTYSDPRQVLRLAEAAEAAGWEGIFVWDHLGYTWGAAAGDPWVILSAVAARTERLRLGVSVAPLPRYRPHVLSLTLASLDLLSGGRTILGAGLGAMAEEFSAFGEDPSPHRRAAMTDEFLALLERLFSGEAVTHHGQYYTVEGLTFCPRPVQRPRIPVWIGGESPGALRRAARWDGWVVGGTDETGQMVKTPEALAEQVTTIRQQRKSSTPFDVAMTGVSDPGQAERPRSYADAGLTWWLESLHGYRGSPEEMLQRVQSGPPV
jgi:alkanesulfonate monooxygenase SsuD/methylene tetrahydromethanopterin reductase-like flavin-dependent oxidoreductase (luciferase family)